MTNLPQIIFIFQLIISLLTAVQSPVISYEIKQQALDLSYQAVELVKENISPQELSLGGIGTLSTQYGSFTTNTATGTQAITGVGFQPKVVLFYSNIKGTSDGTATYATITYGVGISSTSRFYISSNSSDNVATSDTLSRHDNTKCLGLGSVDGTVFIAADFVSQDADGFTINITTANVTTRVINYIALGGTDLTNVAIKEFDSATTTINQSVTGVGFQPDAEMFFTTGDNNAAPSNITLARTHIGFAISSTQRGAMSYTAQDAVNPSNVSRYQRTDKAIALTSYGEVLVHEADFVSQDADGFTINWTSANTAARKYYALCLKGGQYKVGAFNQATATGNQSITGVGFQGSALLLASFNAAATTSSIATMSNSFGAATASTTRGGIWGGDVDAVSPTQTDRDVDRTKVIKTFTAGTPTLTTAADFVSFDADGFTINNTTADATSREILYFVIGVAVGDGAVAPPTPQIIFIE